MRIKTFERYFLYRNRYPITYVMLIALTIFALFYRLGSNPIGTADSEALYALDNYQIDNILRDAINLPHKLLTWASLKIFGGTALAMRLPSVIFGLIFVVSVFATFSIWHKKRIAITATFLAVSSSWFLNIARIGTDYITLPTVTMLLILYLAILWHREASYLQALGLVALLAVAIYTPLMIYLLLLFLVLYRVEIKQKLNLFSVREMIFASILLLGLLSPLIYTIYLDPDKYKLLLGVGDILPSVGDFFANMKFVFSYIFWSSNENVLLHIARLPMLDIFTATMTALGLYHYERHSELLRTRFAIWGLFIAILVASFTGQEEHIILTWPFILIFAATGVITLLTQWYKIFPNNPVARVSAIIPLAILVLLSVNYNLNRFFIAWPNQAGIYERYDAAGVVLDDVDFTDTALVVTEDSQPHVLANTINRPRNTVSIDQAKYLMVQEGVPAESLSQFQLSELEAIYHPIIKDQIVYKRYQIDNR